MCGNTVDRHRDRNVPGRHLHERDVRLNICSSESVAEIRIGQGAPQLGQNMVGHHDDEMAEQPGVHDPGEGSTAPGDGH
jgi:hypothetical protein